MNMNHRKGDKMEKRIDVLVARGILRAIGVIICFIVVVYCVVSIFWFKREVTLYKDCVSKEYKHLNRWRIYDT